MFFLLLDQGPSENRSTWLPYLLRAMRPTNSNCCQINAWPDKSVALLIFMTIVLIFIMYFTGLFTFLRMFVDILFLFCFFNFPSCQNSCEEKTKITESESDDKLMIELDSFESRNVSLSQTNAA